MSDLQETGLGSTRGVERVGDIIHKARIAKDVSIQTIAQELKLNPDYISGIEESNYSKLPAVAYVRVYIKSISKFLGLNSELLLDQFSREMNIETTDPERERRDTISVKVQGSKKNNPFLPLVYITVSIVLIALLLSNGKRKSTDLLGNGSSVDSLKIEIPVDTAELSDDALPKGVSAIVDSNQDSSSVPLPANEGVDSAESTSQKKTESDSSATVKDQKKSKLDSTAVNKDQKKSKLDSIAAVKDQKKNTLKATEELQKAEKSKKKPISFQIDGKMDSSWVKIFADGKKVYDGILFRKDGKTFTAKDSLNIMIGKNSNVRYKLNGSPLTIEGAGLKVLKIGEDKIELWRMNKWNSVFEGR